MTDEVITMNIRIEGDVQGVGFRDFAIREATARKLKGWVRNRRMDRWKRWRRARARLWRASSPPA